MFPGTLLDKKYSLVRHLGQGGMGSVWSAINLHTEGTFALKLLAVPAVGPNRVLVDEARRRLRREATAVGRLRHPNIVQVYDVGAPDSDAPFLVMELLDGENLEEILIRLTRLEPRVAVEIALAIARALAVAHDAGVIHRDLKPANVFVHREPHVGNVVKVLDFGISKVLTPGAAATTGAGQALGTPEYMSPEQMLAVDNVDHRTDFWSLGAVLFKMLTGKSPFEADNPYKITNKVLAAEPPSLTEYQPDADPRLVQIVDRCFQRDVNARFPSAAEIIAALEPLAGAPLPEPQPATVPLELQDTGKVEQSSAGPVVQPAKAVGAEPRSARLRVAAGVLVVAAAVGAVLARTPARTEAEHPATAGAPSGELAPRPVASATPAPEPTPAAPSAAPSADPAKAAAQPMKARPRPAASAKRPLPRGISEKPW